MSSGACVARTERTAAVLDTGPIVHLDELGCLDLLRDFSERIVAGAVREEADRLRPGWQARLATSVCHAAVDVAPILAVVEAFGLERGEAEAIALALRHEIPCVLLCDDAAARLAAEQLGLRVHGTLGVLLRSLRLGVRSKAQVLALLDSVPSRSSLFVRRSLLEAVRAEVERW